VDSRAFGERVFRAVLVVCVLLVASDLFYAKHGHYGWEGWIGFQGAYGFVSCVLLVLTAKQLRRLLKRDEDYYE
jgi:hypothetical protein